MIPVGRSCQKKCYVQYESSNIYYLEVMTNANLRSNVKVKRFSANEKILSLGILMRNIKAQELTVQKL